MKLYEITKDLNELLAIDDIPEDQLVDTINMVKGEFKEKAEKVAAFIIEQRADELSLKNEIDRLSERKRLLGNKISNLEDYLRVNMSIVGLNKITGKILSITLGKHTEVLLIDESKVNTDNIDEAYVKVVKSLDKTLIKQELKSGKEVSGCELVDGKIKLIIK